MEKWELFKFVVKGFFTDKNVRSYILSYITPNFLKLWFVLLQIQWAYLTKKHLRESDTLIEELKDAFYNAELRVRPLSEEVLDRFERLTFTKRGKLEIPEDDTVYEVNDIEVSHTDLLKAMKQLEDEGWDTDEDMTANKYSGEFGDIKDE